MMESDLIQTLVQNVSVAIVLGYWVISERKAHRETLDYYRETINRKIEELEVKIDNLTNKLIK